MERSLGVARFHAELMAPGFDGVKAQIGEVRTIPGPSRRTRGNHPDVASDMRRLAQDARSATWTSQRV